MFTDLVGYSALFQPFPSINRGKRTARPMSILWVISGHYSTSIPGPL